MRAVDRITTAWWDDRVWIRAFERWVLACCRVLIGFLRAAVAATGCGGQAMDGCTLSL